MAEEWGNSDPRAHGVEPGTVVAVRIEGLLRTETYGEAEGKFYDAELFHPACANAGEALFNRVNSRDDHVLALELDWADPHECPVCEESIT